MDGCLQIGDFGLSRLIRDACQTDNNDPKNPVAGIGNRKTGVHTVGVGTLTYASPEQIKGQSCDNHADSYSLGIILFELFWAFDTNMERAKSIQGKYYKS